VKATPLKARRKRRRASVKKYAQSIRGRYSQHKWNAKARGVPFELTFEQWLDVWKSSGHFDERGNKTAEGYVMARNEDKGPYAVGNVSIKPHRVNVTERNRNFAYAKRVGMDWDWYRNSPREPEPQQLTFDDNSGLGGSQ
jgi:hypothetical protein